jgi:hypothetical protein
MTDLNVLIPLLVGAFVVAAVLESALSTLFQWRLYLEFFNKRAVKTLIMIAVGYSVVRQFDYDIFNKIVSMAGGQSNAGSLSRFLSACVLAGGSSAIYQLLKTLGLRPPVESVQDKPKPASGSAWVSIRIIRNQAVGDVRIHLEEIAVPPPHMSPPISGVIGGTPHLWSRLKNVFFADPMRLPSSGGSTLETSKIYRIVASGSIRQANPNDPLLPFEHEIYVGRFAERAIVDFVVAI